jgi:STE24 endopeptidase
MSGAWRRWLLPIAAVAVAAASVLLVGRPPEGGPVSEEAGPAERGGDFGAPEVRVTPAMRGYSHARYALAFATPVIELLALAAILESGLSAAIRDLVTRRLRRRFARAAAYTLLFSALFAGITLPLQFVSGWYLDARYGLARRSLAGWLWEGAKGFVVGTALSAPLVWLLYACLRRSPRRWWLGFWLASLPLMILLMVVGPVLIDPLFHRYEPLRDERLREKILALAAHAGIEGGRVYQVNMSEETKAMNAYVAGLGGTKRIVLWDTLLARLKEEEILFVMAHEMGHYVLGHVPLLLGASAAGLFGALAVGDGAARVLIARRGERWRVRELGDLASLPLLLAIFIALQFLGKPAQAGFSRAREREADAFALRLTGDGEAAARAFVTLSEENLLLPDPPPLVVFWHAMHPPLRERIQTALNGSRQ